MRSILLSATLLVATLGCTAAWAQSASSSEIAPTGTLRVGVQTASPILASRAPDGSVSGVVIDLGKFIANRLGLEFEAVVYVNQETYAQSFGKGEWDIAIGVRSPLVEEKTVLGPDFMVADVMYIAAQDGSSRMPVRLTDPASRSAYRREAGRTSYSAER